MALPKWQVLIRLQSLPYVVLLLKLALFAQTLFSDNGVHQTYHEEEKGDTFGPNCGTGWTDRPSFLKQFINDGVFHAELNELLTRELAVDVSSLLNELCHCLWVIIYIFSRRATLASRSV